MDWARRTSRFAFFFGISCVIAGLICSQDVAFGSAVSAGPYVLQAGSFEHYVDRFAENDEELYVQYIPNDKAWAFLRSNVPLFECPDKDFERTYYFRWWTYRKHIKQTADGFVITEFLPQVPWSGKHNAISCPAGHHFYEGRWIHESKFLDDYAVFWFRKGGSPRRYSFWAADALYARDLVQADKELVTDLLPDLIKNYEEWEKSRLEADGLFWQIDDRDGMEVSIGGSGKRATINSYMYGDAKAIAQIANLAGKKDIAERFAGKAKKLKELVMEKLWDEDAKFFKTLPRDKQALVDVREQHGYTPWYFNLPDTGAGCEVAWGQLTDPNGFYAPFGPTTAEQRHPRFAVSYEGHECQWNGPSWPLSTSITLTALANVLNNYQQDAITKADYFETLRIYTKSHSLKRDDGSVVPWIDENLNPFTGDWLSRTRLKSWKNNTWDAGKGGRERGKDYNHSSYCDLIITGLVGLRPRADDVIEVNPLVPTGAWDWFCLDNILYHGRIITVVWDKTGTKYDKGKGLSVFADGEKIASAESLGRITGKLPQKKSSRAIETSAGWQKYENNPVLGGDLGTCFDVTMLKEKGTYRMWFSWRPKKSVALVESGDGINWSKPRIVLGPNSGSGWEDDINRPAVIKRKGTYHLWYTGQAKGHSWIGYATSGDGLAWKRISDRPVVSSEEPWEDVAVMCPHVIWDEEEGLFRMWYSGGQQYEPNAIGYATSPDGLHWKKLKSNPIFAADPDKQWEQHKVTACQVIPEKDGYLMFYIGFRDEHRAQIGLARSKDGIANWRRHPANPIIFPGEETWDADSCYKPFAIYDEQNDRWLVWYNGRRQNVEQIGLAIHKGLNLGL